MNEMALSQEEAIQAVMSDFKNLPIQTINKAVLQAHSPEYTSYSQELGCSPLSPDILNQKLQQSPQFDMSNWRA